MNIEECYEKLGGNYAEVNMRFANQKMIEKFIGKFLEDESFDILCRQIECGNKKEAFCASHALKSVCANLSFSSLFDTTSRLTEELRDETSPISDKTIELLKDVRRDYDITVDTIHKYFEELQK